MKKSDSVEQEIENTRKATLSLLMDLEEERTALSIAKAKDEALLESLGDGVIATNEKGVIISINLAAEKLLSGNRKDFLDKKIFEVLQLFDEKGDIVSIGERPYQVAFKTGKKTVATYSFGRKDGTKFLAAITVTPVIFEKKIVGAIEIFRDITKEVELDKAKDEFISLASHQLKGPITAISWSLGEFLIKYKKDLKKEQETMLDKIYEINKGMMELVGGFLDVTRMETTGFAIETGKVDLIESCNLILVELAGQIAEKRLQIIKKFDMKVPPVNIGIKTARIIFQNLLTNAIKYSQENGEIEVSIIKAPKGIRVSVKDNGFGIPDEAKPFIFTKLFRANNAKEKEPSGTGLGLYLVKSLLDKVEGKIKFESSEGKGTTFYVDLKK